MSEASFASLGPTLLARKGGAKPAMRPQLAPLPEVVAAEQLEDLGWNDMGQDEEMDHGAAVENGATIVPIDGSGGPRAANEDDQSNVGESPLVHRQQRELIDRVTGPVLANAAMEQGEEEDDEEDYAEAPAPKTSAKTKRPAAKARTSNSRRAAFTLRLDSDRHLKLRLAATLQGTSAQALVTEALDAMLAEIDDLDAIAERFNSNSKPN